MTDGPVRFGKYELLERIASGGMADIFLARAATMLGGEKLLVIKRVHADKARDPMFVELFMREARVAVLLDHPNLVQTYDVGRVDGEYFLAMEYLQGLDLQQLVGVCPRLGLSMPPLEFSLLIVRRVLAGLHYAHEKRDFDGRPLELIHRDVTPQNVRVTFEGSAKLMDFGVAAAGSHGTPALGGKAPYMSPEQANGAPLDRRSDLFSVGILLYELSVGQRLYRARGEAEARRRVISEPTPDPWDVDADFPEHLRDIVMCALAKSADLRFDSAVAMERALTSYCREHGYSEALAPFMRRVATVVEKPPC